MCTNLLIYYYLRFKGNDRISKEPLTDKNDYEPSSSSSSNGITVKVLIGAFVCFFTNSFASGYNIGVLNLPEQVSSIFILQSIIFNF